MVVTGQPVSTEKERVALAGPTFPAASRATATGEWRPSPRAPEARTAVDQVPSAAAVTDPSDAPSTATKTVAPASALPLSVGVGVASSVPSAGAVITGAAGGVVSTVHGQLGGVGSTSPEAPMARAENVC